jgi:hypothetical protein
VVRQDRAEALAKLAVGEGGFGNYPDKVTKIRREENLRSEMQSDLPGGSALPAGTMQAVFCRGQIL